MNRWRRDCAAIACGRVYQEAETFADGPLVFDDSHINRLAKLLCHAILVLCQKNHGDTEDTEFKVILAGKGIA